MTSDAENEKRGKLSLASLLALITLEACETCKWSRDMQ
jgi:hypothetical protein